jgi:hypothetical protein
MARSASVTASTSATVTPRRGFHQRRLATGKSDHRHIGDDEIDRPR